VTYLIAAGGAAAGAGTWLVQRSVVDRWLMARLDAYVRQECGLGVRADRLEIHPFQGRILVRGLAVGEDLFQARLLEVDLEWASLAHVPHLRALRVEEPVLNLDRARLARIRLKPHPASARTPQVQLDRLEILGGQVQVREPAWGVPRGDFRFQATGSGWSPNQLHVDLQVPGIVLDRGGGPFQGDLAADVDITDQRLEIRQGQLRLGDSRLAFQGGVQFRPLRLSLAADGHLDLVQAQRLAVPGQPATAYGTVDVRAKADGPVDALAWTATLRGSGLSARGVPLQPGTLTASAQGGPAEIRLDRLDWTSRDGRLEGSGAWTPRGGIRLQAQAKDIPLAPAAGRVRVGFLAGLTARGTVEASLPPGAAPWSLAGLDWASAHGTGAFMQDGQPVGNLAVRLDRGRFEATEVELSLPELELRGQARGTLGRRGLETVEGEADVETGAEEVAKVLLAWDVSMDDQHGKPAALDMAGRAKAHARLGWAPRAGLHLDGRVEVQDPRWHGARADRLEAAVTIQGEDLRVSDIRLEKGEGRASGDLWLTWADLPKGGEQIDMRYHAERLPIREGLKAADVGDLPLDGIGSGTVRLHGPFDRILMEGQAQAEQGEVFGLRIPAASADFAMDIDGEQLRVTRVRAADSLEHLGPPDGEPAGPLALQGAMDLDAKHDTWTVTLAGAVDSAVLGLQGPRFQAQVDARLEGPFTAPLGPVQLPPGTVSFTRGRVAQGNHSLEGLQGSASFAGGRLHACAGLAGKDRDLLSLDAFQERPDRATGSVELDLGPESADTALLAPRLTRDLLKDARVHFRGSGEWTPKGLAWHGRMDRFAGTFEGFRLVQSRPGEFTGDLSGMKVDLALEGQAAPGPGEAPAAAGGPEVPFEPDHPQRPRRTPALSATSMTLRGRVPFTGDGALGLDLAGSSNLANLKVLLDRVVQPGQYSLLADLHPEGMAQFDLNLGGSLAETTLDGTLTLAGGQLVEHGYPLSIDNLDFTAQFRGRDMIIPKTAPLRGTLAQGALTAWGKLTWRLGGISSYDLHASLEDFQLRDLPTGFEVLGSLDANLKGSDQNGGMLSGSIWANRTLYRAEINLTDLIMSNVLSQVTGLAGDPSDPLARIDLDLELHLAEPWELDTNLVKLQGRAHGPFRIQGTLAQPGLKGRMELLPGGRVTNLFPAGDIVLEQGTVDFQDPAVFNPILDVRGQIDIPPYLVTLYINGPLDALTARPYSTPSLRQDEIFAILIDPSAVTTVGGAQGSGAQTAFNAGLASTSTGLLTSLALANFQEQLRRSLNLDRVNVALRTGVGAPETSFTVGKSVDLLGYRTPLVFTHNKAGDVTTISGQVEWRFGNFVFLLGASQSTADSLAPSGEIRHTWSPR
jgi:hypothetical protein